MKCGNVWDMDMLKVDGHRIGEGTDQELKGNICSRSQIMVD